MMQTTAASKALAGASSAALWQAQKLPAASLYTQQLQQRLTLQMPLYI
jgi:hypothetical protein